LRHGQRYISPTKDDAALVKTGDCLGDMTSELKLCEYISEFVSGGPKNYAYKTIDTVPGAESTVCKVRGFILNNGASQVLNFEKLKHMILKGTEQDTYNSHREENQTKEGKQWRRDGMDCNRIGRQDIQSVVLKEAPFTRQYVRTVQVYKADVTPCR
jgi:hypothetical protein